MKLTVGRIVRYHCSEIEKTLNGGQPQAPAMITQATKDGKVNMRVMWNSDNPTTMRYGVPQKGSSGDIEGPSWDWPPELVAREHEKGGGSTNT